MIQRLRDNAARRAAYRATRDELARLPIDVQLDLGIYAGDADRIARHAVYGA